jgi:hypothetical protein
MIKRVTHVYLLVFYIIFIEIETKTLPERHLDYKTIILDWRSFSDNKSWRIKRKEYFRIVKTITILRFYKSGYYPYKN